jgi:hypothetical protein
MTLSPMARHEWDQSMGREGADHDLGRKQFVRIYNLHDKLARCATI